MLQAARVFWAVMAGAGLIIWITEIPLVYHSALQLHNTTGMFTLPLDWRRVGLHRLGLAPSVYAVQSVTGLSLMTASMYFVGVLIFVRRSREWIALLISYMFVTVGVGIINFYSGGPALTRVHPGLSSLLHLYSGLADLGWGVLFVVPLAFPDGRFVPRWTRWLIAVIFPLFIAPGNLIPATAWIADFVNLLELVCLAAILLSPIYRYLRFSDTEQRQQLKWVTFGFVVAIGIFGGISLVQALVPGIQERPERAVLLELVGSSLFYLGFAFLPFCFALAILRYRLWNIDLILNRALVYGALTVSITGLYVLLVAGLGELFQARGNLLLSLLATGVVAVLFQPLREGLQRGTNRLMYGQRDEPYAVISRLGRQMEAAVAPDAVLPVIVETVAQALKLPYAAIALRQEDELVVAAAVGTPAGNPEYLPLLCQGETVGQLILEPRPGQATCSPSDRLLLDDLARQVGVAAYAFRLTADLQRSRERLVIAREDERRRLRRDLHDGLGPTLAGLFQRLDVVEALVPRDPAAAVILLEKLKGQIKATIADIRQLVYALRPPTLDEYGLVSAIREHASQYSGANGLRVSIQAPEPFPSLPAAAEVAAYRIVLESLTNVARHAHAESCSIRLSIDGALSLEVTDDGVGLPVSYRAGVGLMSMRERAAELGGECTIQPGPAGGTRVFAWLPISKE